MIRIARAGPVTARPGWPRSRSRGPRARSFCSGLSIASFLIAACTSPSPPLRNAEAARVATERDLELLEVDLVGPTWGLVRISWFGGNATSPSEPEWFTLQFSRDGQVQVRADCNRGHGAWTSEGRRQLQLGPLALTRAHCGDDPVNRRFVGDLEKVRTVGFTDEGHMLLRAPSEDVTLEFEPLAAGE